jgi:hypothetical protein
MITSAGRTAASRPDLRAHRLAISLKRVARQMREEELRARLRKRFRATALRDHDNAVRRMRRSANRHQPPMRPNSSKR